MFTLLSSGAAALSGGGFSFSGVTSGISNFIGGTKNICSQMITDEQFQILLQVAPRNDPDMDRVARRFGYNDLSKPYGDPRSTAIWRAPYTAVRGWYRRDCESAGPIGQEVTRDLNLLWSRYGTESRFAPQLSSGGQSGPLTAEGGEGMTAGDAVQEILRNLGRAALETATATVSGGLEGGVAASKGAAVGAETGGTLFGSTTTLLLLGAVGFLAFKAFSK